MLIKLQQLWEVKFRIITATRFPWLSRLRNISTKRISLREYRFQVSEDFNKYIMTCSFVFRQFQVFFVSINRNTIAHIILSPACIRLTLNRLFFVHTLYRKFHSIYFWIVEWSWGHSRKDRTQENLVSIRTTGCGRKFSTWYGLRTFFFVRYISCNCSNLRSPTVARSFLFVLNRICFTAGRYIKLKYGHMLWTEGGNKSRILRQAICYPWGSLAWKTQGKLCVTQRECIINVNAWCGILSPNNVNYTQVMTVFIPGVLTIKLVKEIRGRNTIHAYRRLQIMS